MTEAQIRICVVGDELIAGAGDPRGLGWLGRVSAQTEPVANGRRPIFYTLAVPGETTAALSGRWDSETSRRFNAITAAHDTTQPSPVYDNRLVIGLGRADAEAGISLARSRLNVANILDAAQSRRISAFVIGPPPSAPELNDTIGELSQGYAEVASRRGVPFVDTFNALRDHEQYQSDLVGPDKLLPGQAGHALIAWLVLHAGWHNWLGLPEVSEKP